MAEITFTNVTAQFGNRYNERAIPKPFEKLTLAEIYEVTDALGLSVRFILQADMDVRP